ncbi:MAG: DUF4058 family protein [Cyanobacteria bacterium SBLK]|nr:DUF4058 family protein [Cyanobacteria bacterium SBLK]
MNPYLEQPMFWSAFHSRLIVAIADAIAPQIRPRYYVEIETRTYLGEGENGVLVGIPDAVVFSSESSTPATEEAIATTLTIQPQQVTVPMPEEIKERYLEIREVATGEVVTAIEVLSPKNKEAGRGRQKYEEKRLTILGSLTHLVEIDLLRGGRSMSVGGHIAPTHYRLLVSPSENRPKAMLYGFSLREPIPSFSLPLKGDLSPVVDMQAIVAGIYERAGYDLRIDYTQPVPPPALSEGDRHWLQERLQTS